MFFHKQSKTYKSPLSPARLVRGARIDELKLANKASLVERGREPSVLIVAFTGRAKMLMMPVYEFFDLTNSLGYSRILLRDRFKKRYHHGIDRRRPDHPRLLNFLRQEINNLQAQKTIFIGTSSGGYAAIRVGHDLGANYVHAFGAQTGVNPIHLGKTEREPPLDLTSLLNESNQKTIYYLHYCYNYESDRLHAQRVSGAPGVITLGYPGTTHLVAVQLAKKGILAQLLLIENQERVAALAREFYGDEVIITGERL
jgi:hypothetical protein